MGEKNTKEKKSGNLLSPEANAKSCGFILFIVGLVSVLVSFFGDSYTTGDGEFTIFSILDGILLIVAGYGLYKKKKYGLYSFFLIGIISFIFLFYNLLNGSDITSGLITLVVYILLSVWFWSGKENFT